MCQDRATTPQEKTCKCAPGACAVDEKAAKKRLIIPTDAS